MEARRLNKRRRRKVTRIIGFVVGGLLLGTLIWLFPMQEASLNPATGSSQAQTQPTPAPTINATSQSGGLPASADRLTPPPTTIMSGSAPANQWAEAVLDIAQAEITNDLSTPDVLLWWQSRDVNGAYTMGEDTISVGSRTVESTEQIIIQVPAADDPTQLVPIAEAYTNGSLLYLQTQPIAPPYTAERWVISNANPQLALRALGNILQTRELSLTAAYAPNGAEPDELVFLTLLSGDTLSEPAITATPTLAPTQTPRPTATRAREAHLQRLVAASVDTFLDVEDEVTSNAVYEFAFGHPRTGLLTWTEFGGRVGGKEMSLDSADELTIYGLRPNDNTGSTERLFNAVFIDSITRIPEERVYFQGHRMGEVAYWMVVQAFERGGQLIIVYDDFGSTQAITIIGFEPLD